MNNYGLPLRQSATAEYVLAVIRDHHRQQIETDPEADPGASLTLQTTVTEWRDACDLQPWKLLAVALNEIWEMDRPIAEWRGVLTPPTKRTLADVCAFISRHSHRPVFEPVRLFGHTCAKAEAFLAIRSMLQAAGADVESIAPSTPLAAYTRQHAWKFVLVISRIAPGVLPSMRMNHPLYDRLVAAMLCGLLLLLIGVAVFWLHVVGAFLAVVGGAIFVVASATHWSLIPGLLPESVTFGELRTFRDLAALVAANQPAC